MIINNRRCLLISSIMLLTISMLFTSGNLLAAPKAKTIAYWDKSNERSTTTVNHSAWQKILRKYVDNQHPSGIYRVDYAALKKQGLKQLQAYLDYLATQKPTTLNKAEQKAYWLNLFNAGLVQIIVENYPIDSIRDINPWKRKFITVEGKRLHLDHIEHGILRAIYMDNRVHYGFACGSLDCPNLSRTAFTSDNVDRLLRQLAIEFINHPRAVKIENDTLYLSRIYDWYLADFGGTNEALIEYITFFANPGLKQKLQQGFKKIDHKNHDWKLNKP